MRLALLTDLINPFKLNITLVNTLTIIAEWAGDTINICEGTSFL